MSVGSTPRRRPASTRRDRRTAAGRTRARSSGPSAAHGLDRPPSPPANRSGDGERGDRPRLGEVAQEHRGVALPTARGRSQPSISLCAISGSGPAKAAALAFSLIWFLSRTATAARMPEPYSTVTWPARRSAMAPPRRRARRRRRQRRRRARSGRSRRAPRRRRRAAPAAARAAARARRAAGSRPRRDTGTSSVSASAASAPPDPSATRVARRPPASTNQSSDSAVSPE